MFIYYSNNNNIDNTHEYIISIKFSYILTTNNFIIFLRNYNCYLETSDINYLFN